MCEHVRACAKTLLFTFFFPPTSANTQNFLRGCRPGPRYVLFQNLSLPGQHPSETVAWARYGYVHIALYTLSTWGRAENALGHDVGARIDLPVS